MPLTFLTDHTEPRARAVDEWVVRGWNRRRPDVPVELAVLDHEVLRGRVESYLTAEHPPDVMTWFAGNRTRSLVERGLMLDLAPLWATADLADCYAPELRATAGSDGPMTFLPTSRYWWAVYYRPSVFRSLRIPTPIQRWEQLASAVDRLRTAGLVPFALGAKYRCPAAAWFDYLDMRINGPAFHRELMSLRRSYRDDRVRAVFTFWRRLLDDGWFCDEPTEHDEDDAVAAVLRGEAGMTLIGAYIADEYVPAGETDLDFFRFPIIDATLPIGENAPVDGYFAAANGHAPGQAAEFLGYLGSREVQERTSAVLNVLPARGDVDLSTAARHVADGRRLLGRADHVAQFYDLDTPWELADVGMAAFMAFLRDPAACDTLLADVDSARLRLRATAGPE